MNRTLENGGSPSDGIAIVSNVFNISFEGMTGNVAINDQGDRQVDKIVVIIQGQYKVGTLDMLCH